MSMRLRLRSLSCVWFTAAWLASFNLPFRHAPACQAQDYQVQDPGGQEMPDVGGFDPSQSQGEEGNTPRPGRQDRSKRATPKITRQSTKGAANDAGKTEKTKVHAKPKTGARSSTSSGLIFSQDIAPILVAHCVGCHSEGKPGLTRGKLDLTSFANMMEGTPKEKVIVPGKPDESHLVLRIKGHEEPRMPQGGNNRFLSDEAISNIEQWVKAGAKMDAVYDPETEIEAYASPPAQARRNQLARLGPNERYQKIKNAGLERWKKTNPKLNPEIVTGKDSSFVLFSNLPKGRATVTLKAMEAQYSNLKRLLGPEATDWVEKVSLYVFADRKDLVEFARTIENRELDAGVFASGNLTVPQPYVVVVDPLGGKQEEPTAARKKVNERETSGGPERTLIGRLTEQVGEATVASNGRSPRWLAQGVGTYLSSRFEPRSPYYKKLRETAWEKYTQDWPTKAAEVLGGGNQVSAANDVRAVGFAIVEFLLTPDYRGAFLSFAHRMKQGKGGLDDVFQSLYGATLEDILKTAGEYIAAKHRQDQ